MKTIDIQIQDHGSVVLLVPLSATAKEFFDERIGHANGYQPYWPTVVVEPRYVESIVEDAQAEGLVLN